MPPTRASAWPGRCATSPTSLAPPAPSCWWPQVCARSTGPRTTATPLWRRRSSPKPTWPPCASGAGPHRTHERGDGCAGGGAVQDGSPCWQGAVLRQYLHRSVEQAAVARRTAELYNDAYGLL